MKNNFKELMNSGKFVSGTYLKKNGDVTTFHGRAGVHKHLKGGVSSLNPNNLLIWDLKRKRYMSLLPDNILTLNTSKA
jgi:hypothetical protein